MIGAGVHIYIYIYNVYDLKKRLNGTFSSRLTFSNTCGRPFVEFID